MYKNSVSSVPLSITADLSDKANSQKSHVSVFLFPVQKHQRL